MKIVILAGMSGAGKTSALNVLEGMDYFCTDNLPAQLLWPYAELCARAGSGVSRAAIAVDACKGPLFDAGAVLGLLDAARGRGVAAELLFMDASDERLMRRYRAARRDHPLARGGAPEEGIARERKALEPLEAASASVAKLRSSEWAGKEIPFGEGCAATVFECLCLIEAIKGEKSRPALVKMYGKGTVDKVVGTPADPVTTAAAEAIRRSIVELKERHAAERKALHEKLTEEIRKAAERYNAEVAMAEAEIRRLQGLTEGGQSSVTA